MSSPLSFPFDVVYPDAGDGWILASVPQVPGAFSQGRTRAEARENVRDALRELLLARGQDLGADREISAGLVRAIGKQLDIPAPHHPR